MSKIHFTEENMGHFLGACMRIWYQSFTDPDADRPYLSRLTDYLRSVRGPGCDVEVFGAIAAVSRASAVV
jgi:hypothetical protein